MSPRRLLSTGLFWTLTSMALLGALSLGQPARSAKFELQPAIKGLSSEDPTVIRDSAFRLSQLTPAARILLPAEASTVLSRLTSVIASAYPPEVRQAAAYGLGSITPYLRGRLTPDERTAALEALGRALEAGNPDPLRGAAAWATSSLLRITGNRMPAELRAKLFDELTNLIQSPIAGSSAAAAEALGVMFRNADEPAAGAYREQARGTVASLLNILAKNQDPAVQASVINALGVIHHASEPVTTALTDVLRTNPNADTRIAAARALGEFGSSADTSAPVLASAVLDSNETLQIAAASSLAFIGSKAARLPDVVEYLGIAIQQNDNPKLQETAAWALGRMGIAASNEVGDLKNALTAEAPDVRKNAAWALGEITDLQNGGTRADHQKRIDEAQSTCRALLEIFSRPDPNADVRSAAVNALAVIAGKAERAGVFELLSALEKAQDAGLQSRGSGWSLLSDPSSEQAMKTIRDSIAELRARSFRQHFLSWASNTWVIGITALAALYLIWFAVLRFAVLPIRPTYILRWNDALESQALKLPGILTNINIPLRYLVLVGFYRFHDRILHAWVEMHCSLARESFSSRPPYKDRSVWVSLPVLLQENLLPELTPSDLLPHLQKNCWRIRIVGEGGSGKTAIACQMAIWGMHGNPERHLSRDLMLPVLLGPSSSGNIRNDLNALTEAIRRELQVTVSSTEPISKDLLDKLLRKKRVLVILDGVSEMPHEGVVAAEEWESVKHPDCPVNALVVTSRVNDTFAQGPNIDIAPLRIDANHLLPLMNAYLHKAGLHLDDVTLFESCRRLAAIVGVNRGITPLMARLYAQHLITAIPFTDQSVRQFPRNLPDLVLAYLNALNEKRQLEGPDNPTLHRLARMAAWECLRKEFRPTPTLIADVLAVFEKEGFGRRDLDFLEKSVGLIKVIEPEEKEIYFALDSIADYLGAMRAAELCETEEHWHDLLERCKAASGFPQAVKGFLVALEDYCVSKQRTLRVPQFALNDMAAITFMYKDLAHDSLGDPQLTAANG